MLGRRNPFGDNGDAAGHSRNERYALRDIVDLDPDWNSLRKTHPREDRVDVRQPLSATRCVCCADATCDALDLSSDGKFIAEQRRLNYIPYMDVGELRFLEIGIDPIGFLVNHRYIRRASPRIVANPHQ